MSKGKNDVSSVDKLTDDFKPFAKSCRLKKEVILLTYQLGHRVFSLTYSSLCFPSDGNTLLTLSKVPENAVFIFKLNLNIKFFSKAFEITSKTSGDS